MFNNVEVGLCQNFGALKSLVTSGIQIGHMKMHLLNILNQNNATQKQKIKAIEFFNKAIKIEGSKVVVVKKIMYLKVVSDPIFFFLLSFKIL